ncbi:MAG TPA: PAS domain S-box protein [Pirellulaceae bacterium]|nr:PAS domain S-box protein [Pirellulaceae bacterium]
MQHDAICRERSFPAYLHLAAIVESSDDAIISKSADGTILSWNAGAERLYGYSAEEVVGKSFSVLVLPEHVDEVSQIISRLKQGERIEHFETVRLRKDRKRVRVSISYSPIRDGAGELIGAAAIAREITERHRADARRNVRLAIAETLARSEDISQAAPQILQAVCRGLGWDAGALWTVADDGRILRCLDCWHQEGLGIEPFVALTRKSEFPRGVGLPGRVWSSAKAAWIGDVTHDDNFPRAPVAGPLGLHSAVGFPMLLAGQVLGVVEFFSREMREPDVDLLEMGATIGAQIGQFIERKRVEEALRVSEHRFARFMQHLPGLAWIKDRNGRYVFANESAAKAFQTSAEEIVGRTDDDLFDAPTAAQFKRNDRRALESGSGIQVVENLAHEDGNLHFSLVTKFPIPGHDGNPTLVGGMAIDITDHKRAEQALRFLADASESLAEVDDYKATLDKIVSMSIPQLADWCVVDMVETDGSLRRLAVADADPANVARIFELDRLFPSHPRSPYGRYRVLRTGMSEMMAEIPDSVLVEIAQSEEHLRVLRSLRLKSYLCVPLKVRERTLGILSLVMSQSGRRYRPEDLALAEELARRAAIAIENARLYAELKEADRLKDEFLAMLSHELRNPLAPIRNALYILKQPQLDAAVAAQARETAERQVQHMAVLLDDLLDVSRVSRGRIELNEEPVDIVALAKRTFEAVRPFVERREHRMTVSFPARPLRVLGDPHRLEQVLTNLLNNAAKYTDPGGAISLTVHREGDQAVLRVRDNGIGIDPEMLPKVFDLFVQVERRLDRSQGGVGIGLTLVRKLVELHGGTVEAHSEGLGNGSEFVVKLPALAEESTPPEPVVGDSGLISSGLPRVKILIVDDNHDAATTLGMLLSLSGQDVKTAGDGAAALAVAETWKPDIVFLDIGMPGMNGYEVAQRLRQSSNGKVPTLVAVTGWGQEEDRRRAREAGFDHHLVKPIDFGELDRLLRGLETAGSAATSRAGSR